MYLSVLSCGIIKQLPVQAALPPPQFSMSTIKFLIIVGVWLLILTQFFAPLRFLFGTLRLLTFPQQQSLYFDLFIVLLVVLQFCHCVILVESLLLKFWLFAFFDRFVLLFCNLPLLSHFLMLSLPFSHLFLIYLKTMVPQIFHPLLLFRPLPLLGTR